MKIVLVKSPPSFPLRLDFVFSTHSFKSFSLWTVQTGSEIGLGFTSALLHTFTFHIRHAADSVSPGTTSLYLTEPISLLQILSVQSQFYMKRGSGRRIGSPRLCVWYKMLFYTRSAEAVKAAAEPDKNTFIEDEKRARTTTHQELLTAC